MSTGVELFTVDGDGNDLRQLTDDPSAEGKPTWSPDGRSIAFARTPVATDSWQDIYVMGTDGSGLRNLTRNQDAHDMEAEWSSDGTRIAFSSFRVDERLQILELERIWMVQPNGSEPTLITSTSGPQPSWAPDSERLVFVRYLEGVQTGLSITRLDGTEEILSGRRRDRLR